MITGGNRMSEDQSERVEITRKIRVMTYEVDFAGIVSNQVYFRWLEDMRMDITSLFGDFRDILAKGVVPILAHTEIDYKRPLRLLDEVDGVMWVEEMGDTRWVLKAEFRKGEVVCARSLQWGVFVDTKSLRPVSAPDIFPRVRPPKKL